MKSRPPIVTILGRQNVGKSTLFNSIIREKKAIVDPFPGLTRDVIAYTVTCRDAVFTLTDTPGLDIPKTSELSVPIIKNTTDYLKRSSVLILLMERPSPEPFDRELVDLTRKLSLPTIVAVNKMDNDRDLEHLENFYELGMDMILPVSALRRFNIQLLLDTVIRLLPENKSAVETPDIRLAIVGRPNSGKSTLLNSLIGFERAVVSPVPGTTRDSVDEVFHFQNKLIQVIDTAGIRRKRRVTENIEYYSLSRTIDSIRKCDLVVHLIDAETGLTETDKKISDEIMKAKKLIIIAINKWDAISRDDKTFEKFKDTLMFKFYKAGDFPIISISAREKLRIHKLVATALELYQKASVRVETPRLNRAIEEIQRSRRMPQTGRKIKVLYAVQIKSSPPEFKFFVNSREGFRKDVVRFFEKELQQLFNLTGVPVIIHLEERRRKVK